MGHNRISECEDLVPYKADIIIDKRREIGSIVMPRSAVLSRSELLLIRRKSCLSKKKERKKKEHVYVIPWRQVAGLEVPVCDYGVTGNTYHSVDHSTLSDFAYFAILFHAF